MAALQVYLLIQEPLDGRFSLCCMVLIVAILTVMAVFRRQQFNAICFEVETSSLILACGFPYTCVPFGALASDLWVNILLLQDTIWLPRRG